MVTSGKTLKDRRPDGSMECMRLRHRVDYTIETLARVQSELGNTRGGGREAWERRDNWLRWWSSADSQLRNLFADGDLAASLAVSADKVRDVNLGALPFVALNRETDLWHERLGQVIEELEALKPFIDRPGTIVVPDTSAFIEGEYFTDQDWQSLIGVSATEPVRLVVPILVVEELDDLKRGRDRTQNRARSVLRRLWELNRDARKAVALPGNRPVTIEVLVDGSWHVRRPVNDAEIIERALFVGEVTGRDAVLAAGDYSMLYQASSAGLKTVLTEKPDPAAAGTAP